MTSLSEQQLATRRSRDPAPTELVERRESISCILQVLDTLPESQQEVIRLKFQNELSYREISGITGLSVSNVGFLIHAGLKTIRRRMNTQSPKV